MGRSRSRLRKRPLTSECTCAAFTAGRIGDFAAMRRYRIVHALAQRLWVIPSLGVLRGIALSLVTVGIDRRNENGLLSQSVVGNGADPQAILTTIATAVLTLTSVVLTVTLVAVQLAMGQFSPRIVRALLEDRRNQAAVGRFSPSLPCATLGLREVDDQAGTVPGLTVLVCYLMTLASLAGLILFVQH